MDAIRTSALVKSYERGKVLALNGLDLHVPEGSVFGFLGPNGAGKTTAIKILTGLVEPTSGDAWVAGEPMAGSSSRLRSQIGYLSQDPRFYSWMTGRELLVFAAELYGADRASARRRADELLELPRELGDLVQNVVGRLQSEHGDFGRGGHSICCSLSNGRRPCINGAAIHWPDIDEEVGLATFLGVSEDVPHDALGFDPATRSTEE